MNKMTANYPDATKNWIFPFSDGNGKNPMETFLLSIEARVEQKGRPIEMKDNLVGGSVMGETVVYYLADYKNVVTLKRDDYNNSVTIDVYDCDKSTALKVLDELVEGLVPQ